MWIDRNVQMGNVCYIFKSKNTGDLRFSFYPRYHTPVYKLAFVIKNK